MPQQELVLYPYESGRSSLLWVFDDARVGLKEEAFVSGMSEMITRLVMSRNIPNALRGFALSFSAEPMPVVHAVLHWIQPPPQHPRFAAAPNGLNPDTVGASERPSISWHYESPVILDEDTLEELQSRPSPAAEPVFRSGNWYEGEVDGRVMRGWLCPALYHYFQQAPQRIYIRVEPLPAGVDPIWHVKPGDKAHAFMSDNLPRGEAGQVVRMGTFLAEVDWAGDDLSDAQLNAMSEADLSYLLTYGRLPPCEG